MRWYVQSCGKGYEQGWRWVQVLEDAKNEPVQAAIFSNEFKKVGPSINNLVNNEGFSLLLASGNGEKIVLQVRGLRTGRESASREVVNILACVGSFANG